MREHDHEPFPGLPESLPATERVLWQGSPDWQALAVDAFHVRKVMIYFVALTIVASLLRLGDGASLASAATPFFWMLPMGLLACTLLSALAWYSARTTLYTITDKRIVMRIGMAFTISVNLPFKRIESAAVKLNKQGGDVVFTLEAGNMLSYVILWPHARRWKFARPQPALRSIADADRVASLLACAMAGEAVMPLEPRLKPQGGALQQPVAA